VWRERKEEEKKRTELLLSIEKGGKRKKPLIVWSSIVKGSTRQTERRGEKQ